MTLLTIGVPTFNRADDLVRLLACLDGEMTGDVVVAVSDNASEDRTPGVLRAAAAQRPWLHVHRQPGNVGPFRNLEWLVETAPDAEYLWLFGDDDLLVPGGLRTVVSLLRAERPAWLFLPHYWVDGHGRVLNASPEPGTVERYASAPDLWRAHHHWLTFLTGSIVRREPFRAAVRERRTDNAYAPLVWFFHAAFDGPCAVAPRHVVHASGEISWADRAHEYMTLHFTGLYDEGLRVGLSAEEFGRSLDGFYREGFALDHWRRLPPERLAATVARFPHSSGLRSYLWTIARERSRRDLLPGLDEAARAAGARGEAEALVDAGEAAYAAGDRDGATQRFAAAASLAPTLAPAWNNLAVCLHDAGSPDAAAAVETSLFVDPADADARANRALLVSAPR